ncbi:hypothetical protein TUN199_11632 [Pyrenophora tritici-repentis]|uniref:Uncharacterized protein n=1 Tax=Pyrenophora tritici-repentis TaxID=45151 RepID=A0A5M9KXN9_9PLEO|nr:hypothetical protein PtrV1_10657 [Pyrenophora tritici-repentis]KAF7444145.1 hypothetical protein A1F99_122190 [Pyrenophora tritici-repentis]KAF7566072.1 hypothetical protein PtrM4_143920 [Pyrenophora tritici-repentis]KAI0569304.1 hypothetical protein Alg130_11699 [Pyrenophora tritici-repentis]KAI0569462.1 hypothetical protein Alg215_11625 [Pyrenophora tritici-repentis]
MRFFTVLSILSIGLVAATPLAGPEAAAIAQPDSAGQSCGSCCLGGEAIKNCCTGTGCNYCAGTGGEIC